jgi:hypothetical protein
MPDSSFADLPSSAARNSSSDSKNCVRPAAAKGAVIAGALVSRVDKLVHERGSL